MVKVFNESATEVWKILNTLYSDVNYISNQIGFANSVNITLSESLIYV